ncbi:Der1-like family protein [Durotheca rogersii]|uniref:Der1-like family protein n=1 Tax=Durotheca rogersii TaxID=419775 RepID=UPI002220CCA0|nr:Der1-like family protein [Durotheca rogersii]KAI5865650.1 Der1-like family protein [Durotheca rogersii]
MADIWSVYTATPPISRTVATAVFLSSVGIYTGMLSSYPFFFHYSLLFTWPPAIYRLLTSFLLTGPNIAVLFDTYFVFTYMIQLEGNAKFSKKEDLIWYLMFTGTIIILFTGAGIYLQALITTLSYTVTQDQRGMNAHFYVLTIPAQLMPYCLLLVQLLFPNGWYNVKVGLTGLFAAHLHDFLTRIYPEFGNGPNLIPTPGILKWIISIPRIQQVVYGQPSDSPRDTGRPAGPLPDAWRSKGPGRRLVRFGSPAVCMV